jgi:hypothetical protein
MPTQVPALASMHLALGAADAGVPPSTPARRGLAMLAALVLGLGSTICVAAPVEAAIGATVDQPAATLPDEPGAGDQHDRDEPA